MKFEEIPGQEMARQLLQHDIESQTIAHGYLFHGAEGLGKSQMAQLFAQRLMCLAPKGLAPCGECRSCKKIDQWSHPDVKIVFPQKKDANTAQIIHQRIDTPWLPLHSDFNALITLSQVKEIIHFINMAPHESAFKIVILVQAERMNSEAANALLKSLEEPPSNTVFILSSTDTQNLPATIHSRCRHIPFYPLAPEKVKRFISDHPDIRLPAEDIVVFLTNGAIGRLYIFPPEDFERIIDYVQTLFRALSNLNFFIARDLTQQFDDFSDQCKEWIILSLQFYFKEYLKLSNRLPSPYQHFFATLQLKFDLDQLEQIIYTLDKLKFLIKRNFNLPLIFINFLINIHQLDRFQMDIASVIGH